MNMHDTDTALRQQVDGRATELVNIWHAVDNGLMINPDNAKTIEEECEDVDGVNPIEHLEELPLEVVYAPGRPFSVLFTCGGPHVEIEWDLGQQSARLTGYWGSTTHTRHGGSFTDVGTAIQRTAEHFLSWCEEYGA